VWFGVAGVLASAASMTASSSAKDSRGTTPNIIVILVDDLGYGDVGRYWDLFYDRAHRNRAPYARIRTPNIDRMARGGILFTDFYVGSAVCSPSRAALLTGCYPSRIGITDVLDMQSREGINPDETTLAELLKQKGYATACIGKWHLGHHEAFLPTRHGFDSYYGPMFIYHQRPIVMLRDETPTDTVTVDELTDLYTQEALAFISANKDRPFFLYLAHNMPHVPLGVSEKFRGKSSRGSYGDVVMHLDWSVGEILRRLVELRIDEHTLVIFLSDNGPAYKELDHGGRSKPFAYGKSSAHEGGFRVPCVMWWPGRVTPGKCSQVVTAMDIFPTVAKLVRAEPSNPGRTDGRDIRPLLADPRSSESPTETFYYYVADSLRAVRSGRWKLFFKKGCMTLYDLESDPGEVTDLLSENPAVVRDLLGKATLIRKELGDLATGVEGTNRRPPGRVDRLDRLHRQR
jgi:arylsulfatase A-like enzyme